MGNRASKRRTLNNSVIRRRSAAALLQIRDRETRLIAAIGSGEFQEWTYPLDRMMLDRTQGSGPVLLLPTASVPDGLTTFSRWADQGLSHYCGAGITADVLPVMTREDAQDLSLAQRVAHASLIFLSGGKPTYLAETLTGTAVWAAIVDQVRRGVALAGCSAGACILGELAPYSVTERADVTRWVQGTALLRQTIIVPHWDVLEEHQPGQRELIINGHGRGRWLLSVDEHTAVLCQGDEWRVFGSGLARARRDGRCRAFRQPQVFDLHRSLEGQPLYHRTRHARQILRDGFKDASEWRGGRHASGIWLSNRPLDRRDGIEGDTVLQVWVPIDVAAQFERTNGSPTYRKFCVPASLVNEFGLPTPFDTTDSGETSHIDREDKDENRSAS